MPQHRDPRACTQENVASHLDRTLPQVVADLSCEFDMEQDEILPLLDEAVRRLRRNWRT